jgi:hypothetical protein
LRGQHVEVGLCDAHDQVVFGALQLGFGHVDTELTLLRGGAVGRAVQRLAGRQRDALGVAAAGAVVAEVVAAAPAGVGGQTGLRAQAAMAATAQPTMATVMMRDFFIGSSPEGL